ncbi:MAG: bifunctional 5,10-methylene-tetrahydrofolate dehydrogenase/5,10-methylene-tetrahydrofolate cyclohydrolase [Candidatus Raymondbacteria bacterium RifOxyA12_full_50_37]|uniref:Bifunctional protein FolD n=1 Tax=Candidatus Raymondbacteria bacterium RIFOXYD12_FULL_49_13 TaxID=1817890 RepID=A0A1F7F1K7_UNCRA|nr:MAG: bifunctional 5,10-methylene-tetrahydrofolate dehydrogenase/5,10-methylene-tetrahydrofolate cyclohydrolase [Candidatus Raymondbacteria bacterium RifOxyA12_full_50_37]OGJ93100.1 MAG: bifunctional 5,10-methylene-tetrahydrofolate dehydrogenase/5,10-methylene-tetrahydrofolate cyclohydrolase [Candidatus Raymondbacteria bacterium RifOxyB12_full_50_8]OGJ93938.1 MAG: bifunctional 5,10-methylene-tetrahydrofolate dehydrogenase/5,10-methylene-tetrahydrofolate cyclohydrolase [Candidatus Raymondbacteri
MANLIDGKKVAADMRQEFKERVVQLKARGHIPGLAVVLVGDDPASDTYVRMKGKACEETGLYSETIRLPRETTEEQLIAIIDGLNANNAIDGILVQHPIQNMKDENVIFNRISPEKDVDCFNAINVGKLVLGSAYLFPCTPAGVIELLKRYAIDPKGKHVVIVGRSNIVGKPLANMLVQKKAGCNAVVTVVHTGTRDPFMHTKSADIIIAAAGVPEYITGNAVKEGVVIIDVGTNRVPDASKKSGHRLVGDVHFESCEKKASYITPVPGGVGPMTITMLLHNTLLSAERRFA